MHEKQTAGAIEHLMISTSLDAEAVLAVARLVAEAHVPHRQPNPKTGRAGSPRFWIDPYDSPDARLIVCGRPLLADATQHGDINRQAWVLVLRVNSGMPVNTVSLRFLRGWTKDGLLNELHLYNEFKNHFVEMIQARDSEALVSATARS